MHETDVSAGPTPWGAPRGCRRRPPAGEGRASSPPWVGRCGAPRALHPFSYDPPGQRSRTDDRAADGDERAVGRDGGGGALPSQFGASSGSGDAPSLPWVARDDVLSAVTDRQVLVVGDGVVGRTLTALLQQGGYEPVLAPAVEGRPERGFVQLDATALAAFAHLDIEDPVRDRGTPIDAVHVHRSAPRAADRSRSPSGGRPASDVVVADTAELRRVLAAEWPVDRALTGRAVAGAACDGDGVHVAFEDGVTESFDAVVDTRGTQPLSPSPAEALPTHSFAQHELCIGVDLAIDREVWDVWIPGALVQVVDDGSGDAWVRVTTSRGDATTLPIESHIDGVAGLDADVVAEVLREGVETCVEQVHRGAAQTGRPNWGVGRVARCGVAAIPTAPATGRGVSRGVQDAVAFVAALARHDRSTTAAITTYATTRERDLATARNEVRTADDTASRNPADATSPSHGSTDSIETLHAARTRALQDLLGTGPDSS